MAENLQVADQLKGDLLAPEEPIQAETAHLLAGIKIIERTTGARLSWNEDKTELRINTSLFPTENLARFTALRLVAVQAGLKQAVRADTGVALNLFKQHQGVAEHVLRWQGLFSLRESGQIPHEYYPAQPQNQTLLQEFYWAVDVYILTGKYPDDLPDKVKDVISRIPKNQEGLSFIDLVKSGRHLKFDGQNFQQYLQPLIDELVQADRETANSGAFEYRPSQTPDTLASEEAIEESDVLVRVEPFYGGYYREQVCCYDPDSRLIVKEAGTKSIWDIGDLPNDEVVWQKKKTYRAKITSGQEILIKLPYDALPIIDSLQPPGVFQFMRDELGIISLMPKNGADISHITEFSFDYLIVKVEANSLNNPPTDKDLKPVGGDLDLETQALIDDLATQTWMTSTQKAREIVRYLHQKLRYPQDRTEIGQIDNLYQNTPPTELWEKMIETGIAHCYWANILRDELCKRLGIASRIIAGPYVANKDPRFDFAVVEANGVDKHAWGEVWSLEAQAWTHKGMDATPPKQKDDHQDEQPASSEDLDGDFGEPPTDQLADQPALSDQEIKQIYQQLVEDLKQAIQQELSTEQRFVQQFEQEKGVSYAEWQVFENWIKDVNSTTIPAEMSIKGKLSTLYQEWQDLFDLLCKKRQIPRQVYRGPVRQSEGGILTDPVTAYIDIASGDTDPLGFAIPRNKPKEIVEVSEVDDDFILDISGSMSGLPEEEMRKMVLSASYNIMRLNERLQHSRNRSQMRTPLGVRSTQITFGSGATSLVNKEDMMSERELLKLNKALKAQNQNSAGLLMALQAYQVSLDKKTLGEIKQKKRIKILTIVSDGDVTNQADCIALIAQLRLLGIIVQGIGFGSQAQDIKVVCHSPIDAEVAVVIDDVRQATLTRHKLLMRHLSKL